jgi:hypothetical protein
MSDIPLFRNHMILDACCVINLAASDHMKSILYTFPAQKTISRYVREKEVRYMCGNDGEHISIDLQPLLDNTLLHLVDLESEEEYNTVINLASLSNGKMGNGEAISASIAIHRNWTFATDDRDAILLLQQHLPQLHIVTTPDLLKYWTSVAHPSDNVVREILEKIQRKARYKPYVDHHLEQWWQMYQ